MVERRLRRTWIMSRTLMSVDFRSCSAADIHPAVTNIRRNRPEPQLSVNDGARSPQCVAPVDDEDGARDEAGRVAGEVHQRGAELLRGGVALHRGVLDPVPPELGIVDG